MTVKVVYDKAAGTGSCVIPNPVLSDGTRPTKQVWKAGLLVPLHTQINAWNQAPMRWISPSLPGPHIYLAQGVDVHPFVIVLHSLFSRVPSVQELLSGGWRNKVADEHMRLLFVIQLLLVRPLSVRSAFNQELRVTSTTAPH